MGQWFSIVRPIGQLLNIVRPIDQCQRVFVPFFRTFQFLRWRTSPKPWRRTHTSKSSAWQLRGVMTQSLWWEGVACGLFNSFTHTLQQFFWRLFPRSSSQAFSDMLRANKTLQSLNLESNFITGAGVQALVDALRDNDTLTEIKIDNQVTDALWHKHAMHTPYTRIWNERRLHISEKKVLWN